jgi:hypothetical protein
MRKVGHYTRAARQAPVPAMSTHDTANCYGQPEIWLKIKMVLLHAFLDLTNQATIAQHKNVGIFYSSTGRQTVRQQKILHGISPTHTLRLRHRM